MILGTYYPNRFFIQATDWIDLHPETGPVLPGAVPTHVHEYVHYLHNISTASGLNYWRASLRVLRLLRDCTDREGRVIYGLPPDPHKAEVLAAVCRWMSIILGGVRWDDRPAPERNVRWEFNELRRRALRVDFPDENGEIEEVEIDLEAIGPSSRAPRNAAARLQLHHRRRRLRGRTAGSLRERERRTDGQR